ncbi:hypothetical protein V8E53_010642 [Lactarius tabidus]
MSSADEMHSDLALESQETPTVLPTTGAGSAHFGRGEEKSAGSEFSQRKSTGFHYDFALLGVTTFLAGLLGVPRAEWAADDEELSVANEQPRSIAVSRATHAIPAHPESGSSGRDRGPIVHIASENCWYMGLNELSEIRIAQKILYFLTDHTGLSRSLDRPAPPRAQVPYLALRRAAA